MPSTESHDIPGATAVIRHRIRDGCHAAYETWLQRIAPLCQASPGHLDWHVVRPVPGVTDTYTVIIRFATAAQLRAWMESETRRDLIADAQPLFSGGDDVIVGNGLDFWFTPPGAKAKVPVRWKQALVTWSAIFPLVTCVPLAVVPALHAIGAPDSHALATLVVTAIVVLLMVYVIMPRYTRLIGHWLHR